MHNPKYPVYIVSKGRADSRLTSRSLERMQIPYYIAIEPQDYDAYAAVIDPEKILVLPFSNHGDGPGRARNWVWNHSMTLGAERHWVLDDNISDFYRLQNNLRARVETGAIFRASEDFVDRYENVMIAGFAYRSFVAPNTPYPPYITNTRIYSVLLIDNKCPFKWRGRYNEDTDICLRVLKAGFCTVQFYAFLQGKAATQTLPGGNTEEFYHKEGTLDKTQWREGRMNAEGTLKKSQMLVDMHPDVARLVWRYDRWHHHVDYSPYKDIELKLKPGVTIELEPNNYGMVFTNHFGVTA